MHVSLENLVGMYQSKFLIAYSTINIICYFILVIVGLKIKFGQIRVPNGHFLTKSIIFATVVNFIDTAWKWIEEGPFSVSKQSAILMNTAYFIAMHFMYFFLFIYFYSAVILKPLPYKRVVYISIPTIIMVIINIINMKWTILFYISDDGAYTRTSIYMLEYVIPYIYLCIPYIKAFNIVHKARKDNVPYKKINRDILIVPASIGILGTIGMVYTTVPLLSMVLALAIIIMYIDLLDDFVTIDPISALPNKAEFINELKHRIDLENMRHKNNLYVIIVDIIQLRVINDKYGYPEGDNVIRRVSNILRRKSLFGDKLNIYSCRYRGDKFLLVLNSDSTEDIMHFCTSLQIKISNSDAINQVDYNIDILYGFAKYKTGDSISSLIEDAEHNLSMNRLKYESLKTHNYDKNTIKET